MKTQNIAIVWLVAFILVSCAPVGKVLPTQTTVPLTTSTQSATSVALCGESILVSPNLRQLTIKDLSITLRYPANWECDVAGNLGPNSYGGADGFFQILSTPIRYAKDFCEAQMRQSVGKGRILYGVSPTMQLLQVDNQPACLVLPSDDEPQYRLSMLAVEYPNPDAKYGPLLILDADKNHIHDFIDALKFIRQKP